MQKAGATVMNVHSYPNATHGFSGDDSHNVEAQQKSKERTVKFFATNL